MYRPLLLKVFAIALTTVLSMAFLAAAPALAQSAATGASGLPLPRYVSLKAKRVNLRIGPGRDYAVSWLYTRSGVPMEIIQEYDNWRRVRDVEGTEGWVYQSLLSGDRTAVAAPWKKNAQGESFIDMRGESRTSAEVIARLEPGVVISIRECNGEWCRAEVDGVSGWIAQGDVWGAYPGEAFKQ